jgi:hypothetical protein
MGRTDAPSAAGSAGCRGSASARVRSRRTGPGPATACQAPSRSRSSRPGQAGSKPSGREAYRWALARARAGHRNLGGRPSPRRCDRSAATRHNDRPVAQVGYRPGRHRRRDRHAWGFSRSPHRARIANTGTDVALPDPACRQARCRLQVGLPPQRLQAEGERHDADRPSAASSLHMKSLS